MKPSRCDSQVPVSSMLQKSVEVNPKKIVKTQGRKKKIVDDDQKYPICRKIQQWEYLEKIYIYSKIKMDITLNSKIARLKSYARFSTCAI